MSFPVRKRSVDAVAADFRGGGVAAAHAGRYLHLILRDTSAAAPATIRRDLPELPF